MQNKETNMAITNLLLIISSLCFAYNLYFIFRGIKRMSTGEYEKYKKKNIFEKLNIFVMLALCEPWKTKYKWAGIVQIILFIYQYYIINCYNIENNLSRFIK